MTKQLRTWNPRSYQKEGVKRMLSLACCGLFMKPGRGKTSVALMSIQVLKDAGFVKKTLVVAPIRPAYNVWPHQPHDYKEFDDLRVTVLHGPEKERRLHENHDIYVVNPEGLEWLFGATVIDNGKKGKKVVLDPKRLELIREKFQMLVVDESTKFKSYNSNRFKIIKQVVKLFRRRYILTGSPRPKSLMDLFGQVYILDEGAALGENITRYRKNFFYPDGWGGHDWQPKDGAMEQIIAKMGKMAHVVDDAPEDLPRLLHNDIWLQLPPPARKLYDEMEEELMVEVAAGRVVAANAAVASSKCRQILNGAIYGEDGKYERLHDRKYEALYDLMEELHGAPLLICYEFGFDADWLQTMGIPNLSRMTPKEATFQIEQFGKGRIQAICGHPQSISLGIDGLQHACKDIAMLGVNWSLENYEQVINRVQRSGNPNDVVTLHRILFKDSLDERVIEVIEKRDAEQVDFLKMLRKVSDSL